VGVGGEADACVVGARGDPHIDAVVEAAQAAGARVLVLDVADLEGSRFYADGSCIAIESEDALWSSPALMDT
jgi:hypothetical protein